MRHVSSLPYHRQQVNVILWRLLSLFQMAGVHHLEGRYNQAEDMYRAIDAILRDVSEYQLLHVLTLVYMADLYRAQSKESQAARYSESVLNIVTEFWATDIPGATDRLTKFYGSLYSQDIHLPGWGPLFRGTVMLSEKVRGPNHPDVARHLKTLAEFYEVNSQQIEAETLYQRAVQIAENAMDSDDQTANALFVQYSDLLRKAGRSDEATVVEHRADRFRAKKKIR